MVWSKTFSYVIDDNSILHTFEKETDQDQDALHSFIHGVTLSTIIY